MDFLSRQLEMLKYLTLLNPSLLNNHRFYSSKILALNFNLDFHFLRILDCKNLATKKNFHFSLC